MSFLLDTNFVSELRKRDRCDRGVRSWYDQNSPEDCYLSVVTTAELRRGVELCRLSDSDGAMALEHWLNGLRVTFQNRILSVTDEISDIWGETCVRQPLPIMDGFIAATAIRYRLTVITRNEKDFQRAGVDYFNPFTVKKT
jgi:predicted nucleic acid-binding protein